MTKTGMIVLAVFLIAIVVVEVAEFIRENRRWQKKHSGRPWDEAD